VLNLVVDIVNIRPKKGQPGVDHRDLIYYLRHTLISPSIP